jgi:hypothetical protein
MSSWRNCWPGPEEQIVGAPGQHGGMESFQLLGNEPALSEYHVTFFNAYYGSPQVQICSDLRSARRFAARMVTEDADWATIDEVTVSSSGQAAA